MTFSPETSQVNKILNIPVPVSTRLLNRSWYFLVGTHVMRGLREAEFQNY